MPYPEAFKEEAMRLYAEGISSPDISSILGVNPCTVTRWAKEVGIARTIKEALAVASKNGKLGSGNRGKTRTFTPEWCANISKAKREQGRKTARGVSKKPSGYMELTRGPNKGRLVHVVKMERRIGRRLKPDECVHHIDGNKENNDDSNLALMTNSAHSRLHRREEAMSGEVKERDEYGRFS